MGVKFEVSAGKQKNLPSGNLW